MRTKLHFKGVKGLMHKKITIPIANAANAQINILSDLLRSMQI